MILESHYLHALDIESSAETPLSTMERQDYIARIESQEGTISQLRDMLSHLMSVHDSDQSRLVEENRQLRDALSCLSKEIQSLRDELSKQNDRNSRHNRNTFGKKSLKSSSKPDSTPSREEEKQSYTGPDSLGAVDDKEAASAPVSDSPDSSKVTSEVLDKQRGPRGPYTLMYAAQVETLESLMVVPDGCRFVGFSTIEEYTRESYIKCTRYKVLIVEDSFGVRQTVYVPADASDVRRPNANVIAGTHCTPEFLASLAFDRFQLHLPVYREMLRLVSEKMSMCEQTMSNWLCKGAGLLDHLLPFLKEQLLKLKSVLHIDETWCRVRIVSEVYKNGRYLKKYIWVLVNKIEKVVYFFYDNACNDSRGTRPISGFLSSFIGKIQTDSYTVYRFFTELSAENEHALCWAHVRTRFKDACDISHDKDAGWFVEQIGRLYLVEVENKLLNRTIDEIRERRQRKDVTSILTGIYRKMKRMLDNKRIHFSDLMNSALVYLLNGWDGLQVYRNDGRYDIDNLEAERKIRPFTIGRKNTLSFGSETGVQVATTYYTLIETCKLNGLCPIDYLTHVFRELMNGNKDYKSLLPSNLMLQSI